MTSERLDEQWRDRDFPVLLEVVRRKDEQPTHPVRVVEIERALPTLTRDEIQRAAANLARAGFVDIRGASGLVCHNFVNISERALRETGVWPNEEQLADQMLWFLERKVEEAATPEERTRWQRIRDSIAGAGRDFAVELAAAIAARSMGA